jgi:hypothetical protein
MTRFVNHDEDATEKLEHPSFGMVSLHALSGSGPLFGVDYPTGHSLTLEIFRCQMERSPYATRYYEREPIIKIEFSEVQWARLVASMNSSGVPCTIRRRQEGPYVGIEEPPQHMTDSVKMKEGVTERAEAIAENFTHVRKLVDEALAGTPTKAKLKEIAEWLQQTQQAIDKDMPYLTQVMTEQVDDMMNSAKAEIDAHVQFSLAELGKQALGDQIRRGGVSLNVGGQQVRIGKRETEDG